MAGFINTKIIRDEKSWAQKKIDWFHFEFVFHRSTSGSIEINID